jgi:hypothetical protein
MNVELPRDYVRYLLEYNGGWFTEPSIVTEEIKIDFDRLTVMFGIGASHLTAELADEGRINIWDDNDPPQMLPIGYTLRGNFIVMFVVPGDDDYGEIALKTPQSSYFLASSISEFFETLQTPPEE